MDERQGQLWICLVKDYLPSFSSGFAHLLHTQPDRLTLWTGFSSTHPHDTRWKAAPFACLCVGGGDEKELGPQIQTLPESKKVLGTMLLGSGFLDRPGKILCSGSSEPGTAREITGQICWFEASGLVFPLTRWLGVGCTVENLVT